jgi:hypothetical protein
MDEYNITVSTRYYHLKIRGFVWMLLVVEAVLCWYGRSLLRRIGSTDIIIIIIIIIIIGGAVLSP